ncbi:MAG TPA: glycosyltransferase [Anaerolineae bacterium]|nr:glycosyltransferase [Ardenticatenia bacterium]HQZ71431.1 glycosyltransferase [Anaerolineae bacterium]
MPALQQITLVLPTRNEAANIATFLGALPPDLRLIVVDASDDGTPDIINRLRPRSTQVIRSRAGVSAARQIGAEAAATPWLLFSDADVTFGPAYFKRLGRLPDHCDALYGPKRSVGRWQRYWWAFSKAQQLADRLGVPAVSGSNFLVRRAALLGVGGFDPLLPCNEDSEVGWRLARRGHRLHFEPGLVVHERDHRRLDQGAWRKTAHNLLRCVLLYTGLLPERLRVSDWGYWSQPQAIGTRGEQG